MTFILDSFTDTPGQLLEDHLGELGADWAVNDAYPSARIFTSAAGRIYPAILGMYYVTPFPQAWPTGADYEVSANVVKLTSTTAFAAVVGRQRAESDTAYFAEYNDDLDQWRLKKVLGSDTVLGTYSQALTIGQSYKVTLRMQGTSIQLLVDDVLRISVTDTSINNAGFAGVRFGQATATSTTGLHLDNFRAVRLYTRNTTRPGLAPPPKTVLWYAPGVPLAEVEGTFLRADAATCATYIDRNGIIRTVAANVLRDSHYLYGYRHALLEETSANLVIQSDALATGWGVSGTTPTNAVATYAGRSFSRLAGCNAGALSRVVTLTGDGVKAFSYLIRNDGANGFTYQGLWDATAGAWRVMIKVTVTGTLVTVQAQIGTLLAVFPLADNVYYVLARSISCVAANSNLVYANDTGGNATLTSILLSGFQVENRLTPSSTIPTLTVPVTRAVDDLKFRSGIVPQQCTAYGLFTEIGGFQETSGARLLHKIGTEPSFSQAVRTDGALSWRGQVRMSAVSGSDSIVSGVAPEYGQEVEWRHVSRGNSTHDFGMTVSRGTEQLTGPTSAPAPAFVHGDTNVYLGSQNGGQPFSMALRRFVILQGVHDL